MTSSSEIGSIWARGWPIPSRRLLELFEAIPDLLLALDHDLRVTDAHGAEQLGWKDKALLGRTVISLGLPAPAPGTLEGRFSQADGTFAPVEIRYAPVKKEWVATVRKRSPAAEELKDVNAFLDAVVENIPDMIFVKDARTHAFKRFNRAGEKLLGWKREELLGKTDHDFYPKEQADFFHLKDRETLIARRLVDIPEEPIETRNHGRRWLHTRKVPVLDERGDPLYLLGISEDITQRKATEEELKSVNAFLDAVVENIPDMIFVKDAETLLFKRFNRAGEELLGWTRQQLLGKTDHDFYPKEQADFFHLKDRETLRNKVLVDIPEEPITTKKGLRWLHTRKVPVLGEDGQPKYLLGISEDITRRKEAEERAHALEHELALMLLNAKEAVFSWSLDFVVTSWNGAAEHLYGVSAKEAIGADIRRLIAEEAVNFVETRHAALLAGQTPMPAEVYRWRNGRTCEIEENLFAIRDAQGQVIRIASIARDVGEVGRLRRAAEILGAVDDLGDGEEPPASSKLSEVLETAKIVAADPVATVLILGETGVGKNWLARRIHSQSPRAARPFFELNCASLDSQLAESELFGHERGAFTGAVQQQRGVVEAAEGGTLFLDEVGELALGVQSKLLSFLEGRTFRRVGGTRPLTADVRIIAATNSELKEAVKAGTFRRDLYYRLSVLPLEVPPLRERSDELPTLAKAVLADLSRRSSARRQVKLSRRALTALKRYAWPGNVRELRNALERALILSRGEDTIDLQHLPPEMRGGASSAGDSMKLDDIEKAHIKRALSEVQGNRTKAAELLGISRSTLKRKLQEL